MNKRIRQAIALALVGWLALAGGILAEGGGPAIGWSVVNGAGGPTSGDNVTLNDTLGQPVVGSSGSGMPAAITQGAGYWYGVAAPALAPEVNIDRTTGGAALSWTHLAANAGGHQVWWSTDPYFTPGAGGSDHAAVTAPPWTYTHTGTPGVNYYYVVLGVNAVGQPSPISNRTGRFNFTLVPGN